MKKQSLASYVQIAALAIIFYAACRLFTDTWNHGRKHFVAIGVWAKIPTLPSECLISACPPNCTAAYFVLWGAGKTQIQAHVVYDWR